LPVSCRSCPRCGRGDRLPRGWKVCGDTIYCPQCRRRQFRLRSITVTVAEPNGVAVQELRAALAERGEDAALGNRTWYAEIVEGQPVVRVLIRDRWWELRIKSALYGGQRAAYEKIVYSEAAGELFFYCAQTGGAQLEDGIDGDTNAHPGIICRMVAWLPRGLARDTKWPQDALAARLNQLDPSVLELEQASIGILRKAIHANRASFPSQVPTFTRFDRPELERRIVQLYFVSGWNLPRHRREACAEPRASRKDLGRLEAPGGESGIHSIYSTSGGDKRKGQGNGVASFCLCGRSQSQDDGRRREIVCFELVAKPRPKRDSRPCQILGSPRDWQTAAEGVPGSR